MKIKIILGTLLFLCVTSGTYIYYNRYSFFKYLPAIEDNEKVRNINGKLSVEDGKLFTGRLKKANDEYMDIYSYKDGELNGLNVIYFKNQIKEIGHWKDGKQNGNFKLYTEEGVLVDNTNFKDGERDGVTEQYYNDNGNLRLKTNFKNGVIEGEYIVYYPNGKILSKATYKKGNPIGEYKEYYDNGNLKLEGSFNESGQNGCWKFYSENKILKNIANFKDGALNGIKEDYYDNGNLWTRKEFKNNIEEGIYEVYYEDGTLQSKGKIKNGQVIEEERHNKNSDDMISIKEISEDEEIDKQLEKGMEKLGKTMSEALNSMVETALISNLVYMNLLNIEKLATPEDKITIDENVDISFKTNFKNGVYSINVPLKNDYLWIEMKENKKGKHSLKTTDYEKFRKANKNMKIDLKEIIYPTIDDFYEENNKKTKFFDVTISIKNHS